MKILHITPTFYPATCYGGGPVVVYQLAKQMARCGHEVSVLTTDARCDEKPSSTFNATFIEDRINVHYVKNISNYLAYKYKIFYCPRFNKQLNNYIDYDIIHIHDYRTYLNVYAHSFSKSSGIPYVLEAHGCVKPSVYSRQYLKTLFDKIVGEQILKDAKKLIALSNNEKQQYLGAGVSPDRIKILPNGINPEDYSRCTKRGLFRLEHGIKKDDKIILFLGRIHKIKGLDLLVDAFAKIASAHDNYKLVIAGPDDGYLTTVRSIVMSLNLQEKVIFPGYLNFQQKVTALIDSDVFVLTSISETFPLTVLEASACDVPIVITDCCDLASKINGRVGISVKRDVNDLTNALLDMTNNEINLKYREASKDFIKEYSWDKICTDLIDVYRKAIGE